MKSYNDMLVILWVLDQQDSYVCGSVQNMISRFVKSWYKQHNKITPCICVKPSTYVNTSIVHKPYKIHHNLHGLKLFPRILNDKP